MTSLPARPVAPPRGGTAPPDRTRLAGGERAFLAPLAYEAARRHLEEFPDERERYGDAGLEWCAHDVQWILSWAALESDGADGLLREQLAWLARVLEARGYPVDRVGRAVEIAADVTHERHGAAADALVATLRAGAAALRDERA